MPEVHSLDDVVREMFEQYLREDIREATHQDIATVLDARFGDVPRDLVETIERGKRDKSNIKIDE
jgi:predicted metalloprotease with PDZ domain